MTLTKTRNPNRLLTTQLSRVDWGSFTASFGGGRGGSDSHAGAAGNGNGNGIAAAAAAVASSYREGANDAHLDGSTTDRYGPSRYDPASMNRIVDVSDRQEDGSDISNVSEAGDEPALRRKRRAMLAACTLGIVLAATVLIGVSIAPNEHAPGRGSGANLQVGYDDHGLLPEQRRQERLLEIAQRVVSACGEKNLDEDMSSCRSLCHGKSCCFEKEEKYGCRNDEEEDCAVYAGCEALIKGVPLDMPERSTKQRVGWG